MIYHVSPGSWVLAKDIGWPITSLITVKFAREEHLSPYFGLGAQELHQDEEMTSSRKLLISQATAGIWTLRETSAVNSIQFLIS